MKLSIFYGAIDANKNCYILIMTAPHVPVSQWNEMAKDFLVQTLGPLKDFFNISCTRTDNNGEEYRIETPTDTQLMKYFANRIPEEFEPVTVKWEVAKTVLIPKDSAGNKEKVIEMINDAYGSSITGRRIPGTEKVISNEDLPVSHEDICRGWKRDIGTGRLVIINKDTVIARINDLASANIKKFCSIYTAMKLKKVNVVSVKDLVCATAAEKAAITEMAKIRGDVINTILLKASEKYPVLCVYADELETLAQVYLN